MQRAIFSFAIHTFPMVLVSCWKKKKRQTRIPKFYSAFNSQTDFLSSLLHSVPQFTNLQSCYNNSNISTGKQRGTANVCRKTLTMEKNKILDNLFLKIKNVKDYLHIYTT